MANEKAPHPKESSAADLMLAQAALCAATRSAADSFQNLPIGDARSSSSGTTLIPSSIGKSRSYAEVVRSWPRPALLAQSIAGALLR
jgi:hypothetical protein